ncbi:MAG: MGMT family protein [Candidatus Thorarchaeota archaeon]|nr:MGMT family protein [Candidatus Thorarchaeota archaeon]
MPLLSRNALNIEWHEVDGLTKTLAVLEDNSKYVAGVFSEKGLYQTSLPQKTLKKAIESVHGRHLERDDSLKYTRILAKVYTVMNGKEASIESIQFDFSDLTEKTIHVLKSTMNIPKGETRSYGEVALEAGLPNAARFVGSVMASNRFAPLIPCHRVVASNGLGGYGPGLSMKRALLSLESARIADFKHKKVDSRID